MKIQLVKFNHTVLFEGQQVSFLDASRHKVEMTYNPKTMVLTLSSNKDKIQTNLSNCVYFKEIEDEIKNT